MQQLSRMCKGQQTKAGVIPTIFQANPFPCEQLRWTLARTDADTSPVHRQPGAKKIYIAETFVSSSTFFHNALQGCESGGPTKKNTKPTLLDTPWMSTTFATYNWQLIWNLSQFTPQALGHLCQEVDVLFLDHDETNARTTSRDARRWIGDESEMNRRWTDCIGALFLFASGVSHCVSLRTSRVLGIGASFDDLGDKARSEPLRLCDNSILRSTTQKSYLASFFAKSPRVYNYHTTIQEGVSGISLNKRETSLLGSWLLNQS